MARLIQTKKHPKGTGNGDEKKGSKRGGIKGAKAAPVRRDLKGNIVNKHGRRLRKDGKLWQKRRQAVRAILNIRKAQNYDYGIRFSRASIERCLRAHLKIPPIERIDRTTGYRVGAGVIDTVASALQALLVRRTQRAYHIAMQGVHPNARRRTLAACMYRAVCVPDAHLATRARFEKMEGGTTTFI
jgi:histone H3/H4